MQIDFMESVARKYHLRTVDYAKTFPRFTFPGVSKAGQCFLRIRVSNGTPVFFCVQLRNYNGTSITNAAEYILPLAMDHLVQQKIVTSTRKKSWRHFLSRGAFEKQQQQDLYQFFSEKAVWIEHYPPDVNLDPSGSFALVKFDWQLNPSWSYVRRETAVRASGLDDAFFDVADEGLVYEQD